MRIHHVLRVCLLFVVGTAFASPPTAAIDALADAIGLPAPGPVFIADDEAIDGASRTHEDLKRAASQADAPRRAQWAAAWLCAERSDFACALTHWHALAQSAPNPPRWLPEAYALALWGLGRHEQAIAWYDTAVLGTPHLGNGRVLPGRFFDASLYKVAQSLFEQWSQRLAPLRKTVVSAVDIDPDGRVARVQVLDTQLEPTLARRIQQIVAQWRFPRKQDQTASSLLSTHVYVEVRGRPDGEQRMAFDIQFMSAGVRAVKMVGPAYPTRSLVHGKEGAVVVLVDVNTRGKVLQAHIEQSSGKPLLDQAALAAAKRWRFAMDRIDGEPVASSVKLPFVFTLGTDSDAPSFSNTRRATANQRSGTAF